MDNNVPLIPNLLGDVIKPHLLDIYRAAIDIFHYNSVK